MDAGRAEIVVRGGGWTAGSAILAVWLAAAGIVAAWPVTDALRLGVLAAGPVFGVAAAWAATTWRVLIATPEELRIVRRPIGPWDVVRIARRDLAFVAIEPLRVRDVDARPRWWERGERWAVVARTRTGRTYTVAAGYRDVVGAKRVADEVSRVLGV